MRVQGDVFVVRVPNIPQDAKKVKRNNRGYVLAEGEATGHAHTIVDNDVEVYEKGGILYLHIPAKTGVEIIHEEHKPITVPEGDWEIGQVMEYNPFLMESRRVID